jgi:hypothetical protein
VRREGEEITISYGPWPDTAFFLLFGFLPADNPHNSVVLFASPEQVAEVLWTEVSWGAACTHVFARCAWCVFWLHTILMASSHHCHYSNMQVCGGQQPPLASWDAVVSDEMRQRYSGLVVSGDGWDARMDNAVHAVCNALRGLVSGDAGARLAAGKQRSQAEEGRGDKQLAVSALARRVVRRACAQRLAAAEAKLGAKSEEPTSHLAALAAAFTARQLTLLRKLAAWCG